MSWPAPECHAVLDSTSLRAAELARAGAPHGSCVVAAAQSLGRGRRGRSWASPPGNLYASYVLRPGVAAPAQIGFVAALAVLDAVDAWLPGRARLKWPNDVLVDGAKIAGILAESDDRAGWIVLGIGINLASAPDGLAYPATCLAACGAAAGAESVLARLSAGLGARCAVWQRHGFAPVRVAWLARAHPPGTRLLVGAPPTPCRFADLAEDGALVVDTPAGRRRVVAGEAFVQPGGGDL